MKSAQECSENEVVEVLADIYLTSMHFTWVPFMSRNSGTLQ
jgi:hypothetical protein